jgi:predicted adenylyl cyclase CyaB
MIEVEKKFQPTPEQLAKLLEGAVLVKEKTMHDVYYDFADFKVFKSGNRLRKRDKGFELKVHMPTTSGVTVAHEYTIEAYILKHLPDTRGEQSLNALVEKHMKVLCDFTTARKEYTKGDFIIDVDVMDFGVSWIEIEVQVENEADAPIAEQKILDFAATVGIEPKNMPLKTQVYLQMVKPEVYTEVFGPSSK